MKPAVSPRQIESSVSNGVIAAVFLAGRAVFGGGLEGNTSSGGGCDHFQSGGVQLRTILKKGESCFCLGRSLTPEASIEGGQTAAGQDDQFQGSGAGSCDRWIGLSEWVWPDTITRTKCRSSDITRYYLRNLWWI